MVVIRRLLILASLLLAAACSHDTVELPARACSGTLAVVISGDGGWRAIDRDLAASLSAAGVPVAGIVSTSFFDERKTPAEAARDLDALPTEHERGVALIHPPFIRWWLSKPEGGLRIAARSVA